jgi:hypothetical protein
MMATSAAYMLTVEGFIAAIKTTTKLHTLQNEVHLYSKYGSVSVKPIPMLNEHKTVAGFTLWYELLQE